MEQLFKWENRNCSLSSLKLPEQNIADNGDIAKNFTQPKWNGINKILYKVPNYFFIVKLFQMFQIMVSAIKTFPNTAFLSQQFNLYFSRSEYNTLKCTEHLSHIVSLSNHILVNFEALNSSLATTLINKLLWQDCKINSWAMHAKFLQLFHCNVQKM